MSIRRIWRPIPLSSHRIRYFDVIRRRRGACKIPRPISLKKLSQIIKRRQLNYMEAAFRIWDDATRNLNGVLPHWRQIPSFLLRPVATLWHFRAVFGFPVKKALNNILLVIGFQIFERARGLTARAELNLGAMCENIHGLAWMSYEMKIQLNELSVAFYSLFQYCQIRSSHSVKCLRRKRNVCKS